MPDATAEPKRTPGADTLVVACPADGVLNRVARAKLGADPKCGKCGRPLFQGKPVDLDAASFDRHVLKSDLPVVIDFWAAWCGPCRMLGPAIESEVAKREGKIELAKVDVDAEQELGARYGIQSIPTVAVFVDGEPVNGFVGAYPPAAIGKFLDELIEKHAPAAAA